MYYIYTMLIGSIAGFIPLLPIMAGFHLIMILKSKKSNIKTECWHLVGVYLFCFTLLCVFSVTGTPDLLHLIINPAINLVPLVEVFTNSIQFVLNMVLFIPLGFLLPMLWKSFESKLATFLYGFLLSLFIEITQIFTYRTTDIDDLLMNTAGTVIGYALFRFINSIFLGISKFSVKQQEHWKWEPYFCFVIVWIIMFFIQSPISNWLWEFVLGQ